MRLLHVILAIVSLILLFAPKQSQAQFAGDVFFEDPSQSAATGETIDLELVTFAGNQALGAYRFSIDIASDDLKIIDVIPANADFQKGFVWQVNGDTLTIAGANSVSVDEPIGTIGIAVISLEVLAGSGRIVAINPPSFKLLSTDFSNYPNDGSFGAEIVVTDPPAASKPADIMNDRDYVSPETSVNMVELGTPLAYRLERLRPHGSVVLLADPDHSETEYQVNVRSSLQD